MPPLKQIEDDLVAIGVSKEIELKIKNTKEGGISIKGKDFFIWCGTLYQAYSKFGYYNEVELYALLEEDIGNYSLRLCYDNISMFYKGVNTLNNIDLSGHSWEYQKNVFESLLFLLKDKLNLL